MKIMYTNLIHNGLMKIKKIILISPTSIIINNNLHRKLFHESFIVCVNNYYFTK